MKLGPVTKLYKKSKTNNVKKIDDIMSEYCDVMPYFQFVVHLEQSGSRIPDA